MATTKSPETYERPRFGTAAEVKPGASSVTVTHPDGSRTQVPVGQAQQAPKPKPKVS